MCQTEADNSDWIHTKVNHNHSKLYKEKASYIFYYCIWNTSASLEHRSSI